MKIYANAREAHADGLVWVEVKVIGGKVPFCGRGIGRLSLSGAFTPAQAYRLWQETVKIESRGRRKK